MSIKPDVWIKCDRCGDLYHSAPTARMARQDAKDHGWIARRGGMDYCPYCWRKHALEIKASEEIKQ